MKALYLDCISGISGDMFLGALIDLGVKPSTLEWELQKIQLPDTFHLHVTRDSRKAIAGIRFEVHEGRTHGEKCSGHEHHHHHDDEHEHHEGHGHHEEHSHCCDHEHGHEHKHAHEHHHDHEHHCCGHDHEGEHKHSHKEHDHECCGHSHRDYASIAKMIEESELSPFVKQKAAAIFLRVAKAEAKIHGKKVEDIHFHEVGAIDSIVDIIGACVAIEALEIKQILSSPLIDGKGSIHCAHGKYPIPAPATLEILQGIPLTQVDVPHELITPTGAAILAEFAESFDGLKNFAQEKVGYGLGMRDLKDRPNVLRAILGATSKDTSGSKFEQDEVVIIYSNVDDLSGEVMGHAFDLLMEAGAHDVAYLSLQMKKNRPATQIQVIAPKEKLETLTEIILTQTSAFGIRYEILNRLKLRQEIETIKTSFGPIRVKKGFLADKLVQVSPEFEDCRKVALAHHLTLKEVYAAISKLSH